MNLSESLSILSNKLSSIILSEAELAKAHLTHPEDIIVIQGSKGLENALARMTATLQQPEQATIKWDGSPALIFGYGPAGKFQVMDKHMFDKVDDSGRNVFSPKQFKQYDINRGVIRDNLAQDIANLWPDLQKATPKTPGYYWGDMLFGSPLPVTNGMYVFQPNKIGIEYKVPANIPFAQQNLKGKRAGIAVHQFIPADAHQKAIEATIEEKRKGSNEKFKATDFAQSLNGGLGQLVIPKNSNIAILPSKMEVTPTMNTDKKEWDAAIARVKQMLIPLEASIDKFVGGIPLANATTNNTFRGYLTSYVNHEVREIFPSLQTSKSPEQRDSIINNVLKTMGADFMNYVQQKLASDTKMTDTNKQMILNHIQTNKKGMMNLYKMWAELYKLKMHIYNDLDVAGKQGQVKGYLKTGDESQEGYVAHGVKYVDRLGGFSAQNLAGNRR